MRLSTRLLSGFALMMLISVALAAVAIVELRKVNLSIQELVSDRMVKVDKFNQLKDSLQSVGRFARNAALSKDEAVANAELAKMKAPREKASALVAELGKIVSDPKSLQLLKTINDTIPPYEAGLDKINVLARQFLEDDAIKLLLGPVQDLQTTLFNAVDEAIAVEQRNANESALTAGSAVSATTTQVTIIVIVAVIVGLVVATAVTRGIWVQLGAEPGQVAHAVGLVADGDLTQQIVLRDGDTTSVMAAVRRMQEKLAQTVATIRSGASNVSLSSSQIAQGNHDLSNRTENQAANLEETAASMEQMNATVASSADAARQANKLSASASDVAARGGQLVSQVVTTMGGIQTSSQRIADIIGVIDGIAFQTNILALNAAVEAARAGEQGRGFAVVASEVRTLAQRSADAAKQIKGLIQASVETVDKGARLVEEAGATMNEIVSQVQQVTTLIGSIDSASSEQSSGISQVSQAISNLDRMTQQNAALVEESMAAADTLKSEASNLTQAIGFFRLVHNDEAAPWPVSVVRQRPASAHLRLLPNAGTSKRPATAIAVSKKSAAKPSLTGPKPATSVVITQAKSDAWESF